ncbi:hypothetical protein H7J49_22695 [Mycobacterium branderi]|nr:LppA family lipoprotein [Mycobacterium branderi]MCV7235272.1 hypothetical protein [Mycobacterium branderi]
MRPHRGPRAVTIGRRIVALAVIGVFTVLMGGCAMFDKIGNMHRELDNPHQSQTLHGEQEIQLIDSMRAKGSYEAARERLTDTARVIGERVSDAVPGQTWTFDDDPYAQEAYRDGSLCEKLDADVARRPEAKRVGFGATFSAEGFRTAAAIVREEAAKYGATDESSLFDEPAKREYRVQGKGYEFRFMQMKFAALFITGDCFLLQKVIDSPPGQLPPGSTTAPPIPPGR